MMSGGFLKRSFDRLLRVKKRNSGFTRDFLAGRGFDIGEHTYGKPELVEFGQDVRLTIGKFCSIAGNVKIILGGGHNLDWVSTYPFNSWPDLFPKTRNMTGHPTSKGNICIGNDVWIGHSTIILSGVTIGDGAVIGTASLVNKNIGPYEIWGGNPVRFIRKRFPDEIIEQLMKVQWWSWDIEKIKQHADIIFSNKVEELFQLNKQDNESSP